MKLNPIDAGPRMSETPSTTEAGLKVKSHVKAGLGNAVFNPPVLKPGATLGTRPIAVCG